MREKKSARKGKDFELLYQKLYNLDKSQYTVQSPAYLTDKITGHKREVDLLIEYKNTDGAKRRMSIECRDRGSVQDVIWIEQLIQKKNDLDIDFTIATTTSNFTSPAIKKGEAYGIKIETAQKIDDRYISSLIETPLCTFILLYTKALNIQFKTDKGDIIDKHTFRKMLPDGHVITDLDIPLSLTQAVEMYLNKELFERISIIDEIREVYGNIDLSSKDEYYFEMVMILNDNIIKIQNEFGKIVEFHVKLMTIPIKYSIPITEGIVVNKIDDNEKNKDALATYSDDRFSFSHGYIGQNFYMPIKFGNAKDEYCRMIEIQSNFVTSGVITLDAKFLISFQNEKGNLFENLIGKLDCSELWK